MNPELIRYARKHRYQIAEGFLDNAGDPKMDNSIKIALSKLSPEQREQIEKDVAELSESAGVPLDEAWSAFLNWVFLGYVKRYESQRNN